jgi:hypothetical protein
MVKRRKSKGFIQYEKEAAEIGERIKRGEIPTEEDVLDELMTALQRNMLNMNKKELRAIQVRMLAIHCVGARELAAGGRPLPGNDPSRPN